MKTEIINFIKDMNISYVVLSLLFLLASLLFLKKKKTNNIITQIIFILNLSIAWAGFIYLNDILNNIFSLSFLSVKTYLVLLIIGNIIMLITINKKISLPYKIINYMFFITNILIFITNSIIIIGNKYNTYIIGKLEDSIKLININIIIFIEYINVFFTIYIIKYCFDTIKNKITNKNQLKQKDIIEETIDINTGLEESKEINVIFPKQTIDQEGYYIDGVDCSIIFEDEDQENAMKNYYILLNDINAKLTNGYTLKEYKIFKNIINKLNITDLNNFNLEINHLNKITIDEYNLLKKYFDKKEI